MVKHTFDVTRFRDLVTPPVFSIALDDESSTRALGTWFASTWAAGDVLGLVGNLGAGKTTFTQGFLAGFDGHASSPTYTLLNVYETTPVVYHFDLYRLEDVNDLESVGYWDYAESDEGIAIVEWLDRVPDAWTRRGGILVLERDGDGRKATFYATERVAQRYTSPPEPTEWK